MILIIGILATVAIPRFLAQQAKGHDTRAKAMARHAQLAMETHYISTNTYVGATAAVLRLQDPGLVAETGGPTLGAPSLLSTTAYRIPVTSKTGNVFTITRAATGAFARTCTRPNTRGSCLASLKW